MDNTLDTFFTNLVALADMYLQWTNERPKLLVINPDIIASLSREEGFYQRPELQAQIDKHSPIVRLLKFEFGTVEIYEDWTEAFLHFE